MNILLISCRTNIIKIQLEMSAFRFHSAHIPHTNPHDYTEEQYGICLYLQLNTIRYTFIYVYKQHKFNYIILYIYLKATFYTPACKTQLLVTLVQISKII